VNQLKLSQQQSISTLQQAGWSNRAIARELGLDQGTVGNYQRAQKPASPPPGGGGGAAKTSHFDPPGLLPAADSKPAISTAG